MTRRDEKKGEEKKQKKVRRDGRRRSGMERTQIQENRSRNERIEEDTRGEERRRKGTEGGKEIRGEKAKQIEMRQGARKGEDTDREDKKRGEERMNPAHNSVTVKCVPLDSCKMFQLPYSKTLFTIHTFLYVV